MKKENKKEKENTENTELPNSEGSKEQNNMDLMENKNITENTDIEKEYMDIQKQISDLTKKGLFSEIVNLLKEKEEIIQKYMDIQKQKEEEKKQKIQEIENKIQEKIKEIDLLKSEIRDLKQKKKEIQGYTDNNNNSKIRVVNRINHEYTWNSIKENKAIDIIFDILKEYNISKEAWQDFNKKHSISWNFFIQSVKSGKYPQKENLKELFQNIEDLNNFYEKVKEISIN
jgi:hypothetical protein